MRTTLDIPQELIQEAQEILGYTSKTDVIIYSLREMIRRRRLEELKGLAGQVELKVDVAKSRRRPRKKS
jgi:hypothetical protein